MRLCDLVDHTSIPPRRSRGMIKNLFLLYSMFVFMDCKEPKDKIYALLGLWDRGDLPPVVPNYQLRDEVVFGDVTRRMIEQSGSLIVLGYQNTREKEALPVPSWGVKFGCRAEDLPQPFGEIFNASGRSKITIPTRISSKDDKTLCLMGRSVDVISSRTSCIGNLHGQDIRPVLQAARKLIQRQKPAGFSIDRLGLTLMAGKNWFAQPTGSHDLKNFSDMLKWIDRHHMSPPEAERFDQHQGSLDNETVRAAHCCSTIVQACSKRRFFVTDSGRLGIGPHGLEDGDVIAVLHGSHVPFALRRAGNGGYHLIGACFVDGIMAGEMVQGPDSKRQKDARFHLV